MGDVDRVSMDVIDESDNNAENIDSDAIVEELDAMQGKKKNMKKKICELKKKLRAKKEEKNKYKTKAEDLQAQIDRLKAVDWEGDIVKEYKDSEGTTCYDIQWKISTELYAEDVRQEDLDKWKEVKKAQKKKRKKMKKQRKSSSSSNVS